MKKFNNFQEIYKFYRKNKKFGDKIIQKKKNLYWERSLMFKDYMVGHIIKIYNGYHFFSIYVLDEMLTQKLGSLVFTRKKVEYMNRRKKK